MLAGTLSPDPYTGEIIRFVYGGASELDIDHVVSVAATEVGSRECRSRRQRHADDAFASLVQDRPRTRIAMR